MSFYDRRVVSVRSPNRIECKGCNEPFHFLIGSAPYRLGMCRDCAPDEWLDEYKGMYNR